MEVFMIKNIDNFRVLKATSVKNKQGNYYLLRGGPLDKINKKDKQLLLNKYNLKTVIDFRSEKELKKLENKKIEGVDYFHIEIFDPYKSINKNPQQFLDASQENSKEDIMEILYEEFVLSAFTLNSYRKFLEKVAISKGSVYFHCSAGKDRTGFAAMLLLEILGASEKDIYKDYLLTNEFAEKNFDVLLKRLVNKHQETLDLETIKSFIGVKASYLKLSRDLIVDHYLSVENFISQALKVNSQTLQQIKEKFIV